MRIFCRVKKTIPAVDEGGGHPDPSQGDYKVALIENISWLSDNNHKDVKLVCTNAVFFA